MENKKAKLNKLTQKEMEILQLMYKISVLPATCRNCGSCGGCRSCNSCSNPFEYDVDNEINNYEQIRTICLSKQDLT